MNEVQLNSYNSIVRGQAEGRHDWEIAQFDLANQLFRRSLLLGQLKLLWRRLTRRPVCLIDPGSLEQSFYPANNVPGVVAVPIESITGSEGRCADFDLDFHPRRESSRQRWVTVASLLLAGQSLPAVDLIRVGDDYIVRDGHHRISAALALGQRHIDAHVTVWQMQPEAASQPERVARPQGATWAAYEA